MDSVLTLDVCNKVEGAVGKSNGWNKIFQYKRVPYFVVKKFGRFVFNCDLSFNHYIFVELQVKQRNK